MAITSLDTYIASTKQIALQKKTASRTSVANINFSVFDQNGTPGAGTLAGTSTTTGTVPTDATAGCPPINFSSGTGYITRVSGFNSVASTIRLVDILWKGGAYAYNANTTGNSPTSYSTRVPGGTDFKGLEIWLETVGAFTGNQSVIVYYNDQDGNAANTGTIATGVAPIAGRCFKMPLASGDSGVQGITGVTSTVSSAGTFNILVVRPLVTMRIPVAGYSEQRDLYGTGMPIIFTDSALAMYVTADSTATGLPEFEIEIANG